MTPSSSLWCYYLFQLDSLDSPLFFSARSSINHDASLFVRQRWLQGAERYIFREYKQPPCLAHGRTASTSRRLRLLQRLYRWQWHLKTNCHLATYYSLIYFTFILLTYQRTSLKFYYGKRRKV